MSEATQRMATAPMMVKGYSRAGLLTGYGKDVVGVMVHTAAVVCAQATNQTTAL